MALLAGVAYDPATAASVSTTSLLAMTAIDTTNLRLTFTAPSNGKVMVYMRGSVSGVTTAPYPALHFGVLDGSTIQGRLLAEGKTVNPNAQAAGIQASYVAVFPVVNLTPTQSYTWDAAYGVEALAGAGTTILGWGGPNNTSADDAFGAFDFQIWEASNLLAATLYDPTTRTTKSAASLLAMTAMDTTNLRLTFAAPASGKVLWRIRVTDVFSNNHAAIVLGVLDGSTVQGRSIPAAQTCQIGRASLDGGRDASGIVTGLTPTQSYTWDAAYGVENTVGGAPAALGYGGPNDTTADNANGGISFEIWRA